MLIAAGRGRGCLPQTGPVFVKKVCAAVRATSKILPLAVLILAGGCARTGEITVGGITAVRSACPGVAIPIATGDVTLFDPASSQDLGALDVSATMTNVRSTCTNQGDDVVTNVTFDVLARRSNAQASRDLVLPYFITVVQGGTAVVTKRIGSVALHFDAGRDRASASGQATATVSRAAATLPADVRRELTRKRAPGEEDAAIDPLSRPEIRQALQRATFEALVGFQLTNDQLKYNATR